MPRTEITLDVDSLTLAEMAQVEMESGLPFVTILANVKRASATRLLLARWVQERRSSAQPRSWSELGSLRLQDPSFWTSHSAQDGARETSAT
jgi:hypothetical protein